MKYECLDGLPHHDRCNHQDEGEQIADAGNPFALAIPKPLGQGLVVVGNESQPEVTASKSESTAPQHMKASLSNLNSKLNLKSQLSLGYPGHREKQLET